MEVMEIRENSVFALLLLCLLLMSCNKSQKVVLTNLSSVALTDKAVSIEREKVTLGSASNQFPLLRTQNGDTIPVQLDDLNGDENWEELFFVVNLPANGKETLELAWTDINPSFTPRTSVRFGKRKSKDSPVQPKTSDTLLAHQVPANADMGYQPYQTDGPTWENDKVGFRHYFDGRNAKDVFGKKVSYMSPETVGVNAAGAVEDNYHVMAEWGRDIMAVGNSIGIGGLAFMIGDSIGRLGVTVNDTVNNVASTSFKVLTEGPVRSMLKLTYKDWEPANANREYSLEERPTIWPGMYAYQNTVKVSSRLHGDELLLIGMNNLDKTDPI